MPPPHLRRERGRGRSPKRGGSSQGPKSRRILEDCPSSRTTASHESMAPRSSDSVRDSDSDSLASWGSDAGNPPAAGIDRFCSCSVVDEPPEFAGGDSSPHLFGHSCERGDQHDCLERSDVRQQAGAVKSLPIHSLHGAAGSAEHVEALPLRLALPHRDDHASGCFTPRGAARPREAAEVSPGLGGGSPGADASAGSVSPLRALALPEREDHAASVSTPCGTPLQASPPAAG